MKIFSSTFLSFYFAQNIDCWYTQKLPRRGSTQKLPRRGSSNEYSQSVFLDALAS